MAPAALASVKVSAADMERTARAASADIRRTFGLGFAAAMWRITSTDGARNLQTLTADPSTAFGWVSPPMLKGSTKDWFVWMDRDAFKQSLQKIYLDGDDYVDRMRYAEMILLQVAVLMKAGRMKQSKAIDTIRQTAKQQASVAGMAAAVQFVQRAIRDGTFSYVDVDGKPAQRDGAKNWALAGEAVRKLPGSTADKQEVISEQAAKRLRSLAL